MRTAVLALSIAVSAALVPLSADAADLPRSVRVTVGSECIAGSGPAGAPVTIAVLTPGGRVRGMVAGRTGPRGRFFDCFGSGLERVNGGDRVRAAIGAWVRSWTVPRIGLHIDRTADTVTGTAPATTELPVVVTRPGLGPVARVTLRTAADGSFGASFARTSGLEAGDLVAAVVDRGALRVTTRAAVPWVRVTAATDLVLVVGDPGAGATVRLVRDGATRATGTSTDLDDGLNVVPLRDSAGRPAYPRAGDRLVTDVPGLPTLRVPRSALRGDPSSDRVSGRCMAGAPYQVVVQGVTGFRYAELRGRAGADGRFDRPIRRQMDLRRGDLLDLVCAWPDGDLFTVSRAVG